MKQTAVEWLESQLTDYLKRIYKQEIEHAKEIEKKRIIEACEFFGNLNGVDIQDYEQYYNEMFKNK